MEENKGTPPSSGRPAEPKPERAFIDDQPHKFKRQIGKKVGTALAGFIAGAIVTAVILYPWMYFLGKLCPSSLLPTNVSAPTQGQEAPLAPEPAAPTSPQPSL